MSLKITAVEDLLRLMVSDPLAMNLSTTLGYLRGELKQAWGRSVSPLAANTRGGIDQEDPADTL